MAVKVAIGREIYYLGLLTAVFRSTKARIQLDDQNIFGPILLGTMLFVGDTVPVNRRPQSVYADQF